MNVLTKLLSMVFFLMYSLSLFAANSDRTFEDYLFGDDIEVHEKRKLGQISDEEEPEENSKKRRKIQNSDEDESSSEISDNSDGTYSGDLSDDYESDGEPTSSYITELEEKHEDEIEPKKITKAPLPKLAGKSPRYYLQKQEDGSDLLVERESMMCKWNSGTCSCKFFDEKEFYKHLEDHVGSLDNGRNTTHKCTWLECGRVLPFRSRLKEHVVMHVNYRFPCAKCHQTFRSKGILMRHVKESKYPDSDEFRFICESCNASFCNISTLKKHTKTHLSDTNSDEYAY